LAGFSGLWCQIGFGSAANAYLVNALGLSVPEAGRVMMIYGLIGLFMPTVAGYLCLKFPPGKKIIVIVGHLALAVVLWIFGGISGVVPILLTVSAIGLLVPFLNTFYVVITADNAGPEWAATAGGVSNCIYQIAALLSPLVIGLAADARGDYSLTWVILSTGALIGAVATIWLSSPGHSVPCP
jgi:predicted MFS family arabinose efflux permease